MSLTKSGTLQRNQIPVRVMFNRDGRKPGFFEFDRVARCGANASGQFCQTLKGEAGIGGSFRAIIILGMVFGLIMNMSGYAVSFALDLPVSSGIVVMGALAMLVLQGIKVLRGKL